MVTHESDESRDKLSKLKQERAQKLQKEQGNSKTTSANKKQTRPAPIEDQPRLQRPDSRKQTSATTSSSLAPTYASTYATTPKPVPVQQTEVTQSLYDEVPEERGNEDDTDIDDSVGLLEGKDYSAIIPARLMDQIISQYGVRQKSGKTLSRVQQKPEYNGTARPVKYDDEQQIVTQQRLESAKKTRPQQRPVQPTPLSPVAKLVEQQNRARQYSGGAVKTSNAQTTGATTNNARETIAPRNFRRPQPLQQQQQQQSYEGNQNGYNNNQQNNRLAQRPQQQSSYYQKEQQQQQQVQQLREAESRHYSHWQSRHNPQSYRNSFYRPARHNYNRVGNVVRHHQSRRY